MQFGVFMPKMSLNGHGFESPSGQKTIFPIKLTINVISVQNAVKSTVTVIERLILCLKKVDSTLSFFECLDPFDFDQLTQKIITSASCKVYNTYLQV
jgi:hypothetical protein